LDYRKVCPSLKDDKGPSEVPYTFASFMRFVLLPYAFWLFIFGYLVFGSLASLIARQTDSTGGTRIAAAVAIAGVAFSLWWSWRRRDERQAKRRGYWAYRERQKAWTAALGDASATPVMAGSTAT
jgi:hypothetical protein